METTTIQISRELQGKLEERKISERESYDEIIANLLEDTLELSEETKKELEQSRNEIKAGKFKTLAQIKKELKLS